LNFKKYATCGIWTPATARGNGSDKQHFILLFECRNWDNENLCHLLLTSVCVESAKVGSLVHGLFYLQKKNA
jgi:hypothetical protein